MHRRKYSDEFRSRVLTSIQRGLTNRQAARVHNVPSSTLSLWRVQARIRSRSQVVKPKPIPLRMEAVERFNAGEPACKIARDLGVSPFSVYAWFHKYIG